MTTIIDLLLSVMVMGSSMSSTSSCSSSGSTIAMRDGLSAPVGSGISGITQLKRSAPAVGPSVATGRRWKQATFWPRKSPNVANAQTECVPRSPGTNLGVPCTCPISLMLMLTPHLGGRTGAQSAQPLWHAGT